MNPKVDAFIAKEQQWKDELSLLREIILDCGLMEELKWGKPCYTLKGKNVILIHGFKEYCAVLFHKGALLKDTDGVLVQQTENVQAARHLRFKNLEEIRNLKEIVKAYVFEAIEVEKAGLKVNLKKTEEYPVPQELRQAFDNSPEFRSAFEDLTPGRQRGYLLHFSQPKQSKTRISRIQKYKNKIFEGKGYNER